MMWLDLIADHQNKVMEKLKTSSITDEGAYVLANCVDEICSKHQPLLTVFPFLNERFDLFPDDSIFGAAAYLHLVNAVQAEYLGNFDLYTYSLSAGFWIAGIFLGTDALKKKIFELSFDEKGNAARRMKKELLVLLNKEYEVAVRDILKQINEKEGAGHIWHQTKEVESWMKNHPKTRVKEKSLRDKVNERLGDRKKTTKVPRDLNRVK